MLEQDSTSFVAVRWGNIINWATESYLNKTLDIWISPSYLLRLVRVTRHGPVDELIRGSYLNKTPLLRDFDYSDSVKLSRRIWRFCRARHLGITWNLPRIVSYRSEVTRSSWTAEVVTVVVRVTWILKLLEPLSVKVEFCWIVNLRDKPSLCSLKTSVTCVIDLTVLLWEIADAS